MKEINYNEMLEWWNEFKEFMGDNPLTPNIFYDFLNVFHRLHGYTYEQVMHFVDKLDYG